MLTFHRAFSLSLGLLALAASLPAQNLLWTARDGAPASDLPARLGGQAFFQETLTTDAAGNIYAVGTMENGATPDQFVVKVGPDGTRQWITSFDSGEYDFGEALALDPSGNLFALGRDRRGNCRLFKYDASGAEQWRADVFAQTLALPALAVDGSGNAYVAARSSTKGLLAKLDGAGVRQWTVERPGASFWAAATGPDGSVSVTGQVSGGILIARYAPDGTEIWSWSDANSAPEDLIVDSQGAVHVTGQRRIAPALADALTIKIDAAGTLQWSATYDNGSYESGSALALDGSGNVFVTGSFGSQTDSDFGLLKYSAAGSLLWSVTQAGGGLARHSVDVAVDGSGNAFVAGQTSAGDFLLVSYDPAGNQRWLATHGGTGDEAALAVEVDAAGEIILAGQFFIPVDWDLRIVKFDPAGNERWFADEGSAGNAADVFGDSLLGTRAHKGMVIDAAGNVYLAGTSYNGRDRDVRVTKLDPNGARLWSTVHDGGGDDWSVAAALTGGDGLVVICRCWNGADDDWRVLSYDGTGALRWQASYDAGDLDAPYDVAVDAGGSVYVVGQSRNVGEANAFRIVKYDSSGALQWSVHPDLPRTSVAGSVIVDGAGNVIVGGVTQSASLAWDRMVVAYDPAGNEVWRALAPDGGIPVLASDAVRNVYVSDAAQGGYRTTRYSSAGLEQWERIFGSDPAGSFDLPMAVAVDPGGNVIVSGIAQNFSPPAAIAFQTVKYSSSGDELWSDVRGTDVYAFGLAVDRAGDVYVSGAVWNGSNRDIHTIKYSSAGAEIWTSVYDGGSEDNVYVLALDAAGDLYVGGDSVASATGPDLFALKLDNDVRFGVYAPNGGEVWPIGSSQTLEWSLPDPAANVRIEISRDGGATYQVLFSSTLNDGTQRWTATGPATSQALIRVTHRTLPALTDTSDALFTIPQPALTVQSPNGGESVNLGSTLLITWASANLSGNVRIELSRDGGGSWSILFPSTANDGQQAWTVSGTPTAQALVRVTSVAVPAVSDTSDAPFTIPPATLEVLSPGGGTVTIGSSVPITWTSANLSGNVRIELSRDGGATWLSLFANTPNDGSQSWNVTGPATPQALIRITSRAEPSVSDTGDAFAIPPAELSLQSPNGGETFVIGSPLPITWTSSGLSGSLRIELSRDGGATWTALFAGTPNDGQQTWTATGPETAQALIRIRSRIDDAVEDLGDGVFELRLSP